MQCNHGRSRVINTYNQERESDILFSNCGTYQMLCELGLCTTTLAAHWTSKHFQTWIQFYVCHTVLLQCVRSLECFPTVVTQVRPLVVVHVVHMSDEVLLASSLVRTLHKCQIYNINVCLPMPTHCTITHFGFRTRQKDGVKCGLFSNHALLVQITLRVGWVSV